VNKGGNDGSLLWKGDTGGIEALELLPPGERKRFNEVGENRTFSKLGNLAKGRFLVL